MKSAVLVGVAVLAFAGLQLQILYMQDRITSALIWQCNEQALEASRNKNSKTLRILAECRHDLDSCYHFGRDTPRLDDSPEWRKIYYGQR